MIKIDKHEKALRTNHLLVELYKSGLRGVAFDIWIDKGYFVFHVCIYRHDFKIQWWQKARNEGEYGMYYPIGG